MTWEEIFERGAKYDIAIDDVREALAERREGDE